MRRTGAITFTNTEDLTEAYLNLVPHATARGSPGLSAAVYTQTTNVELKSTACVRPRSQRLADVLAAAHKRIYGPPPKIETVIATSQKEPQEWRFTIAKPADDWFRPDANDSGWQTGPGGFGTRATPGTVVRTEWSTPDIWIRRTFELSDTTPLDGLQLVMHHDEDAEVYLNGELAAKTSGWTTDYQWFEIRPAARRTLRPGKNVIAIHCRQTGGGQYIDAGLVSVTETSPQ